jgi:hypothetical protein
MIIIDSFYCTLLHSRAVVPLPPALSVLSRVLACRSPYEERVLSETRLLWSGIIIEIIIIIKYTHSNFPVYLR